MEPIYLREQCNTRCGIDYIFIYAYKMMAEMFDSGLKYNSGQIYKKIADYVGIEIRRYIFIFTLSTGTYKQIGSKTVSRFNRKIVLYVC